MALTQVSTGGIKDGQVHTADLADAQITAGKLHADALDHTYTLGAVGSDHYTFTGEGLTGAVNDPTLYLTRGKTYRFVNGNSSGAHPFRIQSTTGTSGTEYNTGVTNNAGGGGSTIIFEVPHAAPDVLYYQCTAHANMNGILYITGALADGGVTSAKIANDAVITAKIADGAVTATKMGTFGSNTVGTNQIVDQSVTLDKLPHGTSSNNGKFLRANNGADPTFEVVNSDLVADGTPQLGGNLDCNGNGIALDDSNTVTFGNNSDLSIYHDGSTTNVIKNNVAGRNLKIMSSDNGSLALFNNQAAVELYTNNVKKFETTSTGATVTGTLTATAFAGDGSALTGIAGIPSGVIAIWSGATSAIPSGWVICDGNNSTPDLRDRFVVGAGNTYSVANTGGATSTNTQVSVSGNTGWASQVPNASSNPNASPEPQNSRDRHQHGWGGTFTTSSFGILPPYYALAYIMKT